MIDKYVVAAIVLGVIVASIGAGISALVGFIGDDTEGDRTLEARISLLLDNLELASNAISAIEVEIEKRKELVSKLGQQQQAAEALSQLNREQVEAVAQLLRGEVEAGNRRSFWLNFGVTAGVAGFFYVIGFTSPFLLRKLRPMLGRA